MLRSAETSITSILQSKVKVSNYITCDLGDNQAIHTQLKTHVEYLNAHTKNNHIECVHAHTHLKFNSTSSLSSLEEDGLDLMLSHEFDK